MDPRVSETKKGTETVANPSAKNAVETKPGKDTPESAKAPSSGVVQVTRKRAGTKATGTKATGTRASGAKASGAKAAGSGKRVKKVKAVKAVKPPAYILWEVSRGCLLDCTFCRHSSLPGGTSRDLTTDEGVRLIDSIAKTLRVPLHLTGPEPLVRKDLFELAQYAATRGITVSLATNGSTFDFHVARSCVESRIRQIEIFIDGSSGRIHDGYRGNPNGFTKAIKGLELIRLAGIKFRISSTITASNVAELPKIMSLAQKLGAIGVNIFFNIPVGRGVHFGGDPVPEIQYMEALNWIFDQEMRHPNYIKLQCSPQYERIYRERAHELPDIKNPFKQGSEHLVKQHGCPAAREFMFIGHDGHVYPCPYLLVPAGHVLEQKPGDIWEGATILNEIRDPYKTDGKCNRCKFLVDCRGCRALSFKKFDDPMQEDPACEYQPES